MHRVFLVNVIEFDSGLHGYHKLQKVRGGGMGNGESTHGELYLHIARSFSVLLHVE